LGRLRRRSWALEEGKDGFGGVIEDEGLLVDGVQEIKTKCLSDCLFELIFHIPPGI
jgi:hypothetical protein